MIALPLNYILHMFNIVFTVFFSLPRLQSASVLLQFGGTGEGFYFYLFF